MAETAEEEMKQVTKWAAVCVCVGVLVALFFDIYGVHELFGYQVEFDTATVRTKRTRFFLFVPVKETISETEVYRVAKTERLIGPSENWQLAITSPLLTHKSVGTDAPEYLIATKIVDRLLELQLTNDVTRREVVREFLAVVNKRDPAAAATTAKRLWNEHVTDNDGEGSGQ